MKCFWGCVTALSLPLLGGCATIQRSNMATTAMPAREANLNFMVQPTPPYWHPSYSPYYYPSVYWGERYPGYYHWQHWGYWHDWEH